MRAKLIADGTIKEDDEEPDEKTSVVKKQKKNKKKDHTEEPAPVSTPVPATKEVIEEKVE